MKHVVDIRSATEQDCDELATNMRRADVEELRAAFGHTPIEALHNGLLLSVDCRTITIDGCVMAMWGAIPHEGSLLGGFLGVGWMLTSNLVDKYPKIFLRNCYQELQRLLTVWLGLINFIDCRHYAALRWAKHLGFQLDKPEIYGSSGNLFVRFVVGLEDLNVSTCSFGSHGGSGSNRSGGKGLQRLSRGDVRSTGR